MIKEAEAVYRVELMTLKKLLDDNISLLGLVYATTWGHLRMIPLLCSEELVNEYKEFYAEVEAMNTANNILKGLKDAKSS